MALQVWLPLNGDLKNYGLSDVTVTNSGATVDNNGKIGKCYYFNNKYLWGNLDYSSFDTEFSVCFWYKITTAFSGNKHIVCLANTYGWASLIFTCAATANNVFSFNIGNNSTSERKITCPYITGQWQHICFTFNNKVAKVYINGILQTTATYTINPNWSNIQKFGIGGTPSGQEVCTTLFVNDVRIYDHCLSVKEVKEIAKGLILHYPLKNSISLSLLKYDKNIYTEPDGSKWVRIFHHNNPATALFSQSETWEQGVYKNADMWYEIESFISQFTKFEFMIKQKPTSSSSEVQYRWIQNKNPISAKWADVQPNAVTRITTSGYTDGGNGGLWKINGKTRMVIADSASSHWYGACGSWTSYHSGIPGYPETTITSGYMDLYIKISDLQIINDIIYDCSGYQHNGTEIGTIIGDSDTPKYESSAYFDGSSYINIINPFDINTLIKDFSISCWIKKDYSDNNARVIYNGIIELYIHTNGNIRINWNHAADDLSYNSKNTWDCGILIPNNEWVHIVYTFSNGIIKVYKNGKYVKTSNRSNTGNNIRGYRGTTFNMPDSTQAFIGNVSDFRVYCTALSDDDIKALYSDSASVDKNGNFHTYEYVEGSNRVDINKQGVFTIPEEIIENSLKEPSIDDENIYAKGGFYED